MNHLHGFDGDDGSLASEEQTSPTFAREGLEQDEIAVIHPSIDPFSPKNADQSREQRQSILWRAGIVPDRSSIEPVFTRSDGTPGRVERRAQMLETEPLTPTDGWSCRSRTGTASRIRSACCDPEGVAVYAAAGDAWRALRPTSAGTPPALGFPSFPGPAAPGTLDNMD